MIVIVGIIERILVVVIVMIPRSSSCHANNRSVFRLFEWMVAGIPIRFDSSTAATRMSANLP